MIIYVQQKYLPHKYDDTLKFDNQQKLFSRLIVTVQVGTCTYAMYLRTVTVL